MKKIFIIIISLITIFIFSVGFTRQPYSVSASTVLDYNLFDFDARPLSYSTADATFSDTGFIVSVRENSPWRRTSAIVLRFTLMPNTEYILTYSVEKLVEGSHNRVRARRSNESIIAETVEGNSLSFVTDSLGTGLFEFFAFYSTVDDIDKMYKTKYYNIRLQFADEKLGTVYMNGYNNGLSKRDTREWTPVLDINPWFSYDVPFTPDGAKPEPTMPHMNGINPFGYVMMGLLPGTYRISFIDKTSGFYPLVFDFEGLIYDNSSFGFITPICVYEPYKNRAQMLSLDIFNLDNTPYTIADAYALKPIVFNVPSSLVPPAVDHAELYFYMMRCDSSFNFVTWDNFTEPSFFDFCTIDVLEPTSSYNQGYADGYDVGVRDGSLSGYSEGYEKGYDIGYNAGTSNSITTNWFVSFLNSVFGILNIEVFPNIKLAYLIFIPIGLGVLALIFKLVRG